MSDRMSSGKSDCRIYVGNLPPDVRSKDLEDIFHKFGKIVWVDLKNSKGPPFAFVEFEDPRDADDAIRSRDGYDFDGYRLRVEFPRGAGGDRGGGGSSGGRGGYRGGGDRDNYDRGGRGGNNYVRGGGRSGPPSKRTNFRVLISGLPPTGSWQDLKDHMREAGDVCYSDVFKDGTGVVEFMRYDDMKYAIKKLDDSKFRSHEGETSYIRVKEDSGGNGHRSSSRGRSRSRSRSPVKGRARASPTYSPARRSRSRSYESRSRSRSNSRSKSRSRS